ncbi:MAG: glutathione S-transferase family protein [Roseibium sp.]
MPTLFHAPKSRSSAIVSLIDALDADVDIVEVSVPRQDGSGGPDPRNPHPEKKVPFLVDGDEQIRERGAIIVYLTDKYPAAGLGPLAGEPGRGAYLSWLFYYQGVMEPVIICHMAGVSHPVIEASLRGLDTMLATLSGTLERQPYLLGDSYSAADLLCSSPFMWLPDLLAGQDAIREWVERCGARPSVRRTLEQEGLAG